MLDIFGVGALFSQDLTGSICKGHHSHISSLLRCVLNLQCLVSKPVRILIDFLVSLPKPFVIVATLKALLFTSLVFINSLRRGSMLPLI